MSHDYAQRRRVAVAVAITVIAAPAAFLLNRGDDELPTSPPPTVGDVAMPGASAPPADVVEPAPAATDAMGTAPVAYLDGTAPEGPDDPATIAIPRPPQSIAGDASFHRRFSSAQVCQVQGVPFNATVTVTNLDNSRSVQCIASIGPPWPEEEVILHHDAFLQIADLTDAPVPVQVSW